MKIEESEPGEGKLIATTVILVLCFVVISFVYININEENHKEDLQEIYNKGYIEGYIKGKTDGVNETIKFKHELDSIFWSKKNEL